MISSLWIAKTGTDAQQTNMDVIANNLANVSTNGFKRQRAVFEDLLYQTIRQPGAQSSEQTTLPSGLQIGTGVRPVATERLHSGATCLRPTTAKTWRSKAVASSACSCLTGLLPTPATARSGRSERPAGDGGRFPCSACDYHPGERPEHNHRT